MLQMILTNVKKMFGVDDAPPRALPGLQGKPTPRSGGSDISGAVSDVNIRSAGAPIRVHGAEPVEVKDALTAPSGAGEDVAAECAEGGMDTVFAAPAGGRFGKPGKAAILFDRGLIQAGQLISFRSHPTLTATIINGRDVSFNGEVMTYTRWGLTVTGHKAVNIIRDCHIVGGERLADLWAQIND